MTTDFRTQGTAVARERFMAWRTTMGERAQDVSQEDLWYEAFSSGARWNFRTTSMLAPYLDSFVRLLEFLYEREDPDRGTAA